ncbi:carboxylate-amine ligase [Propioniciclava flava]|nr:YbdK family carboxylate-amine ligase [Propioniciclava flava]
MSPLDFTPSERGSLGIEWEVALVDSQTRALASGAPAVLSRLGATKDGPLRGEYLTCMVELVTGVHSIVGAAVAELRADLDRLASAADAEGLAVYAAGTHPFSRAADVQVERGPSYDTVAEQNAWWARRMLICGTHLHVGVPDRELTMPLVHGLAQLSPLLLALTASSPFFEAEDTGFDSQRTMLFQQLPTNGLPPDLHDWTAFEAYYDQIAAAKMVSGPSEIRWDVRPAPKFGTVELRVTDASPTLTEIGCLAAWAQCLTEYIIDGELSGAPLPSLAPWFVRENKWRAARYGLAADLITTDGSLPMREAVAQWHTRLAPYADRWGCRSALDRALVLCAEGNSAERQRAIAADADLLTVVDAVCAETKEAL